MNGKKGVLDFLFIRCERMGMFLPICFYYNLLSISFHPRSFMQLSFFFDKDLSDIVYFTVWLYSN